MIGIMEHENNTINLNPRHHTKRKQIKKIVKFLGEIILDAVVIIAMVVFIRSYLVAPFQVHGTSMCNTLNYTDGVCRTGYGEYLIISRLGYIVNSPERGDIVVFRPPGTDTFGKLESLFKTLLHMDGQEFFIKRVIGLPGETIDLKNGKVYVTNSTHPDGIKLDEPYLSAANQGNTLPLIPGKTKFVVPEGRYLVFGDNRQVSTDARSCFRSSMISGCRTDADAYIGLDRIEGRAWLVLFPLNKIGTLARPSYGL